MSTILLISIFVLPNAMGSNCDMSFNSDITKAGIFSSPSYPSPYPAKVNCKYEFNGKGRERIQVVFQDFNLYHSSDELKDCDNQDSLVAFVQNDGKMEQIDSFCGNSLPKPIMSNGPKLKLELHSLQSSRYARGFKATYSFTENLGIKTGEQYLQEQYECAFMFNSSHSKSGYFHSPNYPGSYPRNTECHYLFAGNNRERVHLHFNYFDIEGVLPCEAISASDYVEFSNFITRDRLYPRHCGQLKEFDIKSDRNFFRVTFQSNDRLDGSGFNATYLFRDEEDDYALRPVYTSEAYKTTEGVPLGLLFFALVISVFS